jgi:hypothetical protein
MRVSRTALWLLALPLAFGEAARAQGIDPPPGAESADFVAAAGDFAAGRYANCRAGFTRIARATGRAGLSARAAYGAACCAAQGGEIDIAFQELGFAAANGFQDVERLLTDARLDPLHGDERWLQLLRRVEEIRAARERRLEPTLLAAFRELESDRRLPAGADPARATARRATALALVDGGRLREPEDHLHAAAILVESERADEVGRARNLALRALELDPDLLAARPIYATAVDRSLLLEGKPQKFGTQSVRRGERWELYDLDPAVTDADRKAWNVPPLADLRARLAELPTP